MPIIQTDQLILFSFTSLGKGVRHAIFARKGGVSPSPWESLNVGGTVGDEKVRVDQNQRIIFEALGLDIKSKFDVWQEHGTNVVHARSPRLQDDQIQKADAILTNQPGVTIMMRFADCTPILLFDPKQGVAGMVHAGWKGTINDAVGIAIQSMVKEYACDPANILAGIGPSIGPDHYIVGNDVASKARKMFGKNREILFENKKGEIYFDLWMGNRILLERQGVGQIEMAGLCTACNTAYWFSHRAENGRTGRFAALIALEENHG
jgi:YfiH family protein